MADNDWIDVRTRKPTKDDADLKGCVLAWHRYNGFTATGFHQFEHNEFLVFWKPAPAPPTGFEIWEKEKDKP